MKKLIIVFIIILVKTSFSQNIERELVSSSGGCFNNEYYQIDWSIGENLTEMYSNEYYVLTQGFQQGGYNISLIHEIDKEINISVFPNPVTNYITVDLEGVNRIFNKEIIQLEILDSKGNILKRINVDTIEKYQVHFNFSSGIYFMKVLINEKVIKKFKLIKIK